MSSITIGQSLDDTCSVGNSTSVLQPMFLNGLIIKANSTTVPGGIIDQTNISASSAGSLSIRLLNTEFINYKFNSGVGFAGAVMSWPGGVTYNGMANSTLSTGSFFTSTGLSVTTGAVVWQWGTTSLSLIGGTSDVSKAVNINTSGATTGKATTLVAVQTDNRSLTLPDATDTLVGKATTDTLTNKDLQSTTNTFPTKVRRGDFQWYQASIRNGAAALRYPGQGVTSGYQPPENIHLTRLTIGGNVTVALAAATWTVTVWKGAETASTNECFKITQSIAATGEFRTTDSSVDFSGKDAITTTDQVHISSATSAGTSTVADTYIILEYTYDNS